MKKIGKKVDTKEPITLMEPMLPEEGNVVLENLAMELVERASRLAGQMHTKIQESVGDLVCSMNCYYSNLIEGHVS